MISTTERQWRRVPHRRPGQILDAALQRFSDVGYEQTSVRDIARTAEVSVGTVYRYFPSKEHVLDGIHHRFHDGLEEAFDGAVERLGAVIDAGDRLDGTVATAALVDATVEYLVAHRSEVRVVALYVPRVREPHERESHDRRFVDRLAEVLDAGVALGAIATSDPPMTAHLLYHAMRDGVSHALAFGEPADLDRLVRQTKELFARALTLP